MDPAANLQPTRQQLMLNRLTGLCFEAAEDLQARQLAAETNDEAVKLGFAFQGAARSVRQCLAIEMKMVRFVRELAREAPDYDLKLADAREHASRRRGAIRYRRTLVQEAAEPLIFNERDYDEARRLNHELNDWLDIVSERWDFTRANLNELVAEGCRRLGLDPADLDPCAEDAEAEAAGDDPEAPAGDAPPPTLHAPNSS